MARTTVYPASIIAPLVLGKAIEEKGIVPPEKLGKNAKSFQTFKNELRKRKVEDIEEIIDYLSSMPTPYRYLGLSR